MAKTNRSIRTTLWRTAFEKPETSEPVTALIASRDDEIQQRLAKARGICAVAGSMPGHALEVPDVVLPDALWAARDLLDEAEAMV